MPFSTAHLSAQANELALVALPGLLALLGAVLFARRKVDGKDPFLRFLVISTVCVQLFASTWNPELGAYADWDLFAVAGLFYALLGAYTLAKFAGDRETLCHAGGTIVAVCLVLTGSWVASNATRHVEVDALHDDAHLRSGYRHVKQGRLEAALAEFEEVLRINPRNGDGLLALGRAHWDRGERERARPLFETYLQLEPYGPQAERVRQFLARARSSM